MRPQVLETRQVELGSRAPGTSEGDTVRTRDSDCTTNAVQDTALSQQSSVRAIGREEIRGVSESGSCRKLLLAS